LGGGLRDGVKSIGLGVVGACGYLLPAADDFSVLCFKNRPGNDL